MPQKLTVRKVLALTGLLVSGVVPAQAQGGAGANSLFAEPQGFSLAGLKTPDQETPAAAGTTWRYTLQGSRPTATSQVLTGGLQLTPPAPAVGPLALYPTTLPGSRLAWRAPAGEFPRLTVVRTQAFRDGVAEGPVVTRSYALGRNAELLEGPLPVVSLTLEPGDLVGREHGIYVPGSARTLAQANFSARGRESERPVHVEWFENGQRLLAQDAGVRISGNATRALPQKSLNLYARSAYGPGKFRFSPFAERGPDTFDKLRLRSSGQDQEWTRFRDCLIHDLLRPTGLDVQRCRPARVFINGEYWGLHNLREDADPETLAGRHRIQAKDVVIVDTYGLLEEGDKGDDASFWELLELLETGGSVQEVEQRLDLNNTFDYLAAQLFTGNDDWPENNASLWRHSGPPRRGPADGRWRWIVEDTDQSYNHPDAPSVKRLLGLSPQFPVDAQAPATLAFRYVMNNPKLRGRFLARLDRHLQTTFAPQRALDRIDFYHGLLAPEMPRTVARWHQPASLERWEFEVGVLRDFAVERPRHLRAELASLR